LLRLVMGQGLRVAVSGVVLGSLVALAVGRFAGSLLFDVEPNDPLIFAAVALTLLTAATLASLGPGVRATRADPNRALRAD
jgi:putative ABC transport system permease protein